MFKSAHLTPQIPAEARVRKGIDLLDRKIPGWRIQIDFDALDIGWSSKCVMGQLFGDFGDGIRELGLADIGGYEFGFASYGGREGFRDLTDKWKELAPV